MEALSRDENIHSVRRRREYTPYPFVIDSVDLFFDLDEHRTRVSSRLRVRCTSPVPAPLILDASFDAVAALRIDGAPVPEPEYFIQDGKLVVHSVPREFLLEAETLLDPAANTALEGLYLSGEILCTQCESEGFRRITCYPDRPDVTSVFTIRIAGDREKYPVLLSNGNLVESGDLPGGRHYAVWHDPHRKPAYLFALVAGDLAPAEDTFVTRSGREVLLQVWVEEKNLHRTGHSLECLRDAMRWDEETFGREYDLDRYMIVAVDHFNAGAMENKGLNVFNSNLLFADPETATDRDYELIRAVIAHEYFHNWTGNRVTLRDWFQLSLKEGLTIFRDQEFSADMESRPVKRISDVRYLRTAQFPEDAGPLAHPVRPESYAEISNFYTATVYEKGAEVVRMLRTILGEKAFLQGMGLYFSRHDGTGATIEDFVQAMADASGRDLRQFMRWYSQAGTPLLNVRGKYDGRENIFSLTVRQDLPPVAGRAAKPLQIPFAVGLLDREGKSLPLSVDGDDSPPTATKVLVVSRREETFRFRGVPRKPVPSLLRDFSAPVRIEYPYREEELALLMAHDPDPFNRWEASQRLGSDLVLHLLRDPEHPVDGLLSVFASVLREESDRSLAAELLTLPGERYVADLMPVIDPQGIHAARERLTARIAGIPGDLLAEAYAALAPGSPYSPCDHRQGERKLRNLLLSYLAAGGSREGIRLAFRQFRDADNMTARLGAVAALNRYDSPERRGALDEMYRRWHGNSQVVDKWLSLQAVSPLPDTLEEVRRLLEHEAFDMRNPNRVRALIGAFCSENQLRFHDPTGAGYRFLADMVLRLDAVNPQSAAKLLPPLVRWERHDSARQTLMRGELERIAAEGCLSTDVRDIVTRGLRPAAGEPAGAAERPGAVATAMP